METLPLMILTGLFLPPLMGLVTRFIKDSDARFWTSTVLCLILGGAVWYGLNIDRIIILQASEILNGMIVTGLQFIGMAKISYESLWDNKEVSKYLPDAVAKDSETPLEAINLSPINEK